MRDAIRWQWQHSMPPTKELRYSITLRTRAWSALRAIALSAAGQYDRAVPVTAILQ